MTKTAAIKKFFGDVHPVENKELVEFRKADPAGYDEVGLACIATLGETLAESA